MKQNLTIFLGLVLVLTTSSLSYAQPLTEVSNPHNMSYDPSGVSTVQALPKASGGTDEICVFCHTPHSAAPQTPLWNRPDPEGPFNNGSFPVYGTTLKINETQAAIDLSGYESGPGYPSGASRMCLSCHDGATSVGVLLGNQVIAMKGGLTTLSTSINLATSHPISFNYNNDVLGLLTGYTLPTIASTPLDGADQMQCTTCHDPHEDTSGDASYGNLPFWRHQGNAASYDEVCNSCHSGVPGTPPHIP